MLHIAIIEDEDKAADTLCSYLRRFESDTGESVKITRFADARPLLNAGTGYDLVFMDIELPGMSGMEAARRLRTKDRQAKLIFVTNMAQYAVEGYQVDALDFMVKPVTYADFSFKMKRALSAIEMSRTQWLVIQQSTGLTRISSGELLYVEVQGHTLTYHLERQEHVKARGTLSDAEQSLRQCHFLRCNNCYLVNPEKIRWVRGYLVNVGGDELQISHPRRKQFLKELCEWYTKRGA
ncbi:MAG: LytTR family DNA-binding domain-containing protein [Clostridiales bacterium]|nr:LytTR family DNA-binding domain-containing protein [Clostridiales bacterium]